VPLTPGRLPFLAFDGAKQQFQKTPFYFDLHSEYDYFYREQGSRGHRADLHPRFYLPYHYKNYFTFEPSIGLRETVWYTTKLDDDVLTPKVDEDRFQHRELYDIKLDLFSEISRVYHPDWSFVDRIKHTLRPQIVYDYIPPTSQDQFPNFDSPISDLGESRECISALDNDFVNRIDRIDEKNLITYSITNTFRSRSPGTMQKSDKPAKEKAVGDYSYREFGRFKIEQSYDINKEKDVDSEPFSAVCAELELNPGRYFTMKADAAWSPYDGEFLSRNIAVGLSDNRGDRFYVQHRFDKDFDPLEQEQIGQDKIDSIYTELILKITDRWWAFAEYERNLQEGKDIKTGIGFLYASQCWAVDFGATDKEGDIEFSFMVNLYGLAGIGEQSPIGSRISDPFESQR
jgi:LPS-assembly protein